jgi:hypothetical protein
MNKIKTIIYLFIAYIFLFNIFAQVNFCFAQGFGDELVGKMGDNEVAFRDAAGFKDSAGQQSLTATVSVIIKAFLGLLGIIFIIMLLLAGFNWMTAGGEEEKVNKAKDTIKRAIIGLIIIVAAYAITHFVFTVLPWGSTTR